MYVTSGSGADVTSGYLRSVASLNCGLKNFTIICYQRYRSDHLLDWYGFLLQIKEWKITSMLKDLGYEFIYSTEKNEKPYKENWEPKISLIWLSILRWESYCKWFSDSDWSWVELFSLRITFWPRRSFEPKGHQGSFYENFDPKDFWEYRFSLQKMSFIYQKNLMNFKEPDQEAGSKMKC